MAIEIDSSSLVRRTGSAAGFRLAGNVANIVLGLTLGVILARLLPPAEFGIFGIGLGITSFIEIVGSIGIFQALVQRKTLAREDEATAAVMQTVGSLLLAAILVSAGPAIEAFFGMPGLGPLIQLQSLVLVINALALVPNTRLTRRLAFNRLTVIDVSTRTIGGILSIFLALRGMGALALAFGSIATGACRTCLLWTSAPGRVPILFQLQSAKNLLGYGTGILFIRIFNDLAHRFDVLIIGQRLGADVTGLYQRAYHLVRLPLYQFTGAVNTVLFPAMAGLQDENDRFRRGYLGSVGLTSMLAFPALTLLWTTADLLIPLLYGPMWSGTVPVLMSLGFVGYLRVANNPNGLVTQARGRVVAEAVCQAMFVVLTVLSVYLGTYFGVLGAVFGIGAASLVFLIMMTTLALSIAGISFRHWLTSFRTSTFASLTMALVVLGLKTFLFGHISASLLLLVLITSGGAAYMLSLRQLLTVQERQILDRFLPLIPRPLKNSFQFCIGTSRG